MRAYLEHLAEVKNQRRKRKSYRLLSKGPWKSHSLVALQMHGVTDLDAYKEAITSIVQEHEGWGRRRIHKEFQERCHVMCTVSAMEKFLIKHDLAQGGAGDYHFRKRRVHDMPSLSCYELRTHAGMLRAVLAENPEAGSRILRRALEEEMGLTCTHQVMRKQQTTNNKQQTTSNKQQSTNNKQQTTNKQTTNNKQQTHQKHDRFRNNKKRNTEQPPTPQKRKQQQQRRNRQPQTTKYKQQTTKTVNIEQTTNQKKHRLSQSRLSLGMLRVPLSRMRPLPTTTIALNCTHQFCREVCLRGTHERPRNATTPIRSASIRKRRQMLYLQCLQIPNMSDSRLRQHTTAPPEATLPSMDLRFMPVSRM